MRKVLGTALILVVLVVFAISCSDFGLFRGSNFNDMKLAGIGMSGVILANHAIAMYMLEPDLVDDMITVEEDELSIEATFHNFDFRKAFNLIDEEDRDDEWDEFFNLNAIIQEGSFIEDSGTDSMTMDITFKFVGGEYPGTYRVEAHFSENSNTLKVDGRKINLSSFSN